jgi:pimeloyl-ACP methyl ester carboxylesterase
MEQLSLFPGINTSVEVSDPILKKRLEQLVLRKGYRSFGRTSRSGLHEIGIELESKTANNRNVPIVALPGWLHGNWAYIKLIQALAKDGIEISALSPIGEEGSKPLQKPIGELTVEDYLIPYRTYLSQRRENVVLMGHSLGGLFAQRLKAEFRDSIKGLILINSVKPSNIVKRIHNTVAQDGPVFTPIKEKKGEDKLKWIHENLFNSRVPEDFLWIADSLSVGSNNLLDDYNGEHGYVDPARIDCPILEFISTDDKEETAGVFNAKDVEDKIKEVKPNLRRKEIPGVFVAKEAKGKMEKAKSNLKGNLEEVENGPSSEEIEEMECWIEDRKRLTEERRVMISEFFADRTLSGTGNCPCPEQIIIEGGSHCSLILCEEDVEKVAQGILENYKKMFC